MKGLLAKKEGMTQVFDDKGQAIPVTVVTAGPCVIIQKKTIESDGYQAIQIGFCEVKEKKVNKPMKNHFEKSKKNVKHLKEIRLDNEDLQAVAVGQELTAGIFEKNESVKVQGFTIGKGFAGGIKRWNFKRQAMTHGCKARRLPGSMAASDRGGRIWKGKRMGGRLGNEKVTMENLEIVNIDGNIILIKGAVPGPKNGLVYIYNESNIDFTKYNSAKPEVVKQESNLETIQGKETSPEKVEELKAEIKENNTPEVKKD